MINSRRTAHLILAVLVTVGCATAAAGQDLGKAGTLWKRVKDVGRDVDDLVVTEEEEIAIGEAVSRRIRGRYGVVQDPAVTRYVTLVGLTVVEHSSRRDLSWRFIVLDSPSINAFAAPGGYLHVTRGALALIPDEAGLAGVLGHEAGHVVEKHTVKALRKAKGMGIARERGDLRAGSAVLERFADRATEAILAGFGRAEELEADAVGVQLAVAAGYHRRGLSDFLVALKRASAGGGDEGLFRSHPETDKRLDRLAAGRDGATLDAGAVLPERYAANVSYEHVDRGGGVIESQARGIAGGASEDAAADAEEPDEERENQEDSADSSKRKLTLKRLMNPFEQKRDAPQSGEVIGAAAGRAVGDKEAETEGGPRVTTLVPVKVSSAELDAFRSEGGLN